MGEKVKNIRDEDNPIYALSIISTEILSAAVNGKLDLNELAKEELSNRGLDNNGKWIGFSD